MSRIFDMSFNDVVILVQINPNISRLLPELVCKIWSKGALETVNAQAVGIFPIIRWKCEKTERRPRRWKEVSSGEDGAN